MCEVLDKSKLEEKNKTSKIQSVFKKIGLSSKEEEPLSAEKAWCESTYGENTYKSIEERILDKQCYIRSVIKSKFAMPANPNVLRYASYHCVVDIEEDLINYEKEIFKPFIENGFDVINLSKECKNSIIEPSAFFISWKNAFSQKGKK